MTHLESLTEKLHALLPELLELSFGCEVNFKGNFGKLVTGTYFLIGEHGGKNYEKPGIVQMHDEMRGAVILGQPITLEHVLKALSRAGFIYMVRPVNATSCWIQAKDNAEPWDLALPLHKQSSELHEFLDNLLPKQH